MTNATVLPRRTLGIRVLTGFARFDELIGNGGPRNIAASFNTDSLNGNHISQLAFTQAAIRSLTGNSAFNVTAGNLVSAANSRVVTAPLIAEYGLTSKLTIGVVIPLVETRSTVLARLNPHAGAANVGPNPANAGNWATNAALVSSLRAAATALQSRLTQCQASPSSTGCSALLAQQGSAQTLIQSTDVFAGALRGLYGIGTDQPGVFFVPLNNSPAQSAIVAQINNLRTQYQGFGGTVVAGAPSGASGPAAFVDLQNILKAAGYDSLQSADHSSIGDISIGATYQLANSFGDSARIAAGAMRYRVALNGTVRIGTGQPANRNRLFDNATGYGQPGLIAGAATDVQLTPRYSVTALGSYTLQLGSVTLPRAPNPSNDVLPLTFPAPATYKAGDVLSLVVVPRIRVGGFFSIDGHYGLTRVGADDYTVATVPVASPFPPALVSVNSGGPGLGASAATTQQVGIGFSYSTVVGNERGPGRLPFEASFRHLETISASGGPVAKVFQDQVQLRVFFR